MFQLNLPSTWDVSTKYTANSFSRCYFQMCFAGSSMGNSADADQMSPDVALHLHGSSLLNEFTCIKSKSLASSFTCMEIRQAYSVEQTVYFESQTDRVLIYVEFTAMIVLKYRGILSLD